MVAGLVAQSIPALAQTIHKTPARAGKGSAATQSAATAALAGSDSAASGSAATAAPAQKNPPDIVELKDGGMYRGTISEKVPGDHVVIVTLTGATKTFSMQDVKYAGPASQAPGAEQTASNSEQEASAKPAVTLHADESRVIIKGDQPGLTLYRQTVSAVAFGPGGEAVAKGYDMICTAPCDASLPAGTHILAVAKNQGQPVETAPVKLPKGESKLTVHYDTRGGTRLAGWLVMGGGVAAGLGLTLLATTQTRKTCPDPSLPSACYSDSSLNTTYFGVGLGATVVGALAGMILVFQHDKVSVSVTPIEAGMLRHRSWSNPALDHASLGTQGAPGLGLTARF